MATNNKRTGTQSTREDAPLLADDSANDVESDSEDGANRDQQDGNWPRKLWQWISSNLMILAIILLLIGGIVALCVYFAGELQLIKFS